MKLIHVGAAVLNQTPLAWATNQRHISTAIRAARERGVSLLCLPELAITGYGCEDAFHAPGVQATALAILHEIAAETTGLIVAVGLPLAYRKALFDAVALLVDGQIAGFVAKRHLAGDGLYYEPRWFKPWPQGHAVEFELAGASYPLGDLCFVADGVIIGFEVCEDAWVAERPGGALAARGVDILLNPSASHFAFGKHEIRKRFVLEGSRAFGVSYVYTNLLGNDAGRIIYDGGALIAAQGQLVAEGPRLCFAKVVLTSAIIDIEAGRRQQIASGSFRPNLEPHPNQEIRLQFAFPQLTAAPTLPATSSWLGAPDQQKEEEFTRAVALGLGDYLEKSRARGFVVSLSGGADSSAVSCLVALSVELAVAELGLAGFRARLPHLDLAACTSVRQLVGKLLTCVYQATRNSSTITRQAAEAVAKAIGADFHALDVDPQVEATKAMVAHELGRPLTWESDDLALQNVQARVRGPGIWLLANLRGALLLSTSNRSEAAVGYATMDGDTCGGLSPIAGIDKAFLRHWLRWLEQQGPAGLAPIPALALVNAQQPTAELRPANAGQTDEADLMPYEILDAIERAAVRDKKMPLEVFPTLCAQFPQFDPAQFGRWIERFFRLWCRNQWKRERYAPSFHLDDENLDPKSWCRFPILSGGFERELAELRALLPGQAEGIKG